MKNFSFLKKKKKSVIATWSSSFSGWLQFCLLLAQECKSLRLLFHGSKGGRQWSIKQSRKKQALQNFAQLLTLKHVSNTVWWAMLRVSWTFFVSLQEILKKKLCRAPLSRFPLTPLTSMLILNMNLTIWTPCWFYSTCIYMSISLDFGYYLKAKA